MTNVRVELSGFGHYGVCTLLPAGLLGVLRERIAKSHHAEKFKSSITDSGPFGIDEALRVDCWGDEGGLTKVIWSPRSLGGALLSNGILTECASLFKPRSPLPVDGKAMTLEVSAHNSGGWSVQANLSDSVWDVIESASFPEILVKINQDIRSWWEDQTGHRSYGQCAILFAGKDGPTLQINQSSGNGLWIVGSRKSDGLSNYQFHDYNTDSSRDAVSHVMTLCFVLKHCRLSVGT